MDTKELKIAVAGTGYVGLSIATLLSQHHQVTAVDVIPEKVDMLNRRQPAYPSRCSAPYLPLALPLYSACRLHWHS